MSYQTITVVAGLMALILPGTSVIYHTVFLLKSMIIGSSFSYVLFSGISLKEYARLKKTRFELKNTDLMNIYLLCISLTYN